MADTNTLPPLPHWGMREAHQGVETHWYTADQMRAYARAALAAQAQADPVRHPLTDVEAVKRGGIELHKAGLVATTNAILAVWRSCERAHGITGEPAAQPVAVPDGSPCQFAIDNSGNIYKRYSLPVCSSCIPAAKETDKWESCRIADFNSGWNACRAAMLAAAPKGGA